MLFLLKGIFIVLSCVISFQITNIVGGLMGSWKWLILLVSLPLHGTLVTASLLLFDLVRPSSWVINFGFSLQSLLFLVIQLLSATNVAMVFLMLRDLGISVETAMTSATMVYFGWIIGWTGLVVTLKARTTPGGFKVLGPLF